MRGLDQVIIGFALATGVGTSVNAQGQAVNPWVVVESTNSQAPLVAKILDREPSSNEKAAQKRLLRVSWRYQPAARGLPDEKDLRKIARLEDDLSDALKEGKKSTLAISETGNGERYWLFYVGDDVEVKEAVRGVSLQQQTRLSFSTVDDSGWIHLRDFRARVK